MFFLLFIIVFSSVFCNLIKKYKFLTFFKKKTDSILVPNVLIVEMTSTQFKVIYDPVSIATEYVVTYELVGESTPNSQTVSITEATISENALINVYNVKVAYKVGDLTSDFTSEITTGTLDGTR